MTNNRYSAFKYGTGYDDPTAPPCVCLECGGYRTGVAAQAEGDCTCKWPRYGEQYMTRAGFMAYWSPALACYVSIPDDDTLTPAEEE